MSLARFVLSLVILFAASTGIFSQVSRGTVKEGLTLHGEILGKDVRYTIYLPFDYETSSRYYPVVYLLHGYTDNDMGWIQFGEANLIADDGIAKMKIPPMILVMPDGGVSYYINSIDNTSKYEDFFFDEFIPYIESHYRIRTERRYRGIAGLSMGGYGTLVYALKHPDLFSGCAALSAGIMSDEVVMNIPQDKWDKQYGVLYGYNLSGKDRISEAFKENSPFYIIQNSDLERIKQLRIYIDCGDEDIHTESNSLFHVQLTQKGIPHEYRARDGKHQWGYWRSGLPDALKFIGESFHQP